MAIQLTGKEGYQFVIDNAQVGYIYSGVIKIEELFIRSIQTFFEFLKKAGYYPEDVEVPTSSMWNKDKAQYHQVVVKVKAPKSITGGFGNNSQDVFIDGKQYTLQQGQFNIQCQIKCISTSRKAVSSLVDAILVGLSTNIGEEMGSYGFQIPPNTINAEDIMRSEVSSNLELWECIIDINNINVSWQQITEPNGELLKDISYYIEKLNND